MGNSSSKHNSFSPKIFANDALASLARIWKAKTNNDRGLIHYRQDVDIRAELEAIKRSMGEMIQERDEAKDEIMQKGDALAAVQQERDTLNERMEELSQQLRLATDRIAALKSRIAQEEGQTSGLRQQLTRSETEMQIVSNELAQTKTRHSQTTALLDTRTLELKGAQAFLTKADSMSGADVVRMVEGLDAEILQTAAFIADHFIFEEKRDVTEEVQAAIERLVELLGPTIVDLLGTTEHAHDPTLIQLACQASMAVYSRWIILAWDFDDNNYDQFLKHIYMTVQGAGERISV
jgi:DNA repair exonuclease SbcCD ATPase subunit